MPVHTLGALVECIDGLELCTEKSESGEKQPPKKLRIFPKSGVIKARDGRIFHMQDASAVIKATIANGREIPVDIEHATHPNPFAPPSDPKASRAVAWVNHQTMKSAKNGPPVGDMRWLQEGSDLVVGELYKYYSPAFMAKPLDDDGINFEVGAILSIGLTNNPALRVPALASYSTPLLALKGKKEMPPEVLKALGLDEGATEAQIAAAVIELCKSNGELAGQLAHYRGKTGAGQEQGNAIAEALMTLSSRLDGIESLINKDRAETLDEKIKNTVEHYIQAGKCDPTDRDFMIAACKAAGGVDAFVARCEKKEGTHLSQRANLPSPSGTHAGAPASTDMEMLANLNGPGGSKKFKERLAQIRPSPSGILGGERPN